MKPSLLRATSIAEGDSPVQYIRRDGDLAASEWVTVNDTDLIPSVYFSPFLLGAWPPKILTSNYLSNNNGESFSAHSPASILPFKSIRRNGRIMCLYAASGVYLGGTSYQIQIPYSYGYAESLQTIIGPTTVFSNPDVRNYYYEDDGTLHLLVTDGYLADDSVYYYRSDDCGETWTDGVLHDDGSIPPFFGGPVGQSSSRSAIARAFLAHGDYIVSAYIEDWTEHWFVADYDVEYRAYFPGKTELRDLEDRYLPCDIIYKMSVDKGETWGSWSRIKNDELQTRDSGGTTAWGKRASRASLFGSPSGPYVSEPDTYNLDYVTIDLAVYDDDLYIFASLVEDRKPTGSTPIVPEPLIGYFNELKDQAQFPSIVAYKAAGITGTPSRVGSWTSDKYSYPNVCINDDEGETLIIVARDNGVTKEVWFANHWSSNVIGTRAETTVLENSRFSAKFILPISQGGFAYLF